jgi:hypothetical protein
MMNEWINVKNKLPENDKRVLACCGGDVFFASYLASMMAWRRNPSDSGMEQWVTHWMPIPELPKV